MSISVLGIDHGVESSGNAILKKRLSRDRLAAYIAGLPRCRIVMEARGGANLWARVFQRNGHLVKLISPQFVKPL